MGDGHVPIDIASWHPYANNAPVTSETDSAFFGGSEQHSNNESDDEDPPVYASSHRYPRAPPAQTNIRPPHPYAQEGHVSETDPSDTSSSSDEEDRDEAVGDRSANINDDFDANTGQPQEEEEEEEEEEAEEEAEALPSRAARAVPRRTLTRLSRARLPRLIATDGKTPKSLVYEYCQQYNLDPPESNDTFDGPDHCRTFRVELTVPWLDGGRVFAGTGTRRKDAEQDAFRVLAAALALAPEERSESVGLAQRGERDQGLTPSSSAQNGGVAAALQAGRARQVADAPAAPDPLDGKNPKSVVMEFCQKGRLAPPAANTVSEGPDHARSFHCTLSADWFDENVFDGQSFEGVANTKKQAEQKAMRKLALFLLA